jgi:hypothetical protein
MIVFLSDFRSERSSPRVFKKGDMLVIGTIFRSDPILRMYCTVVFTISNRSHILKYWVTLSYHGSWRFFGKYVAMKRSSSTVLN